VSDDEAKVTKEMQGVSEEKALKSLLTSDEDEDENKYEQNNTDVEEEENQSKKTTKSNLYTGY